MTSEEVRNGFPAWAKVLIAIVAVVLVGTIALLVGGIFIFQNVIKKSQDPVAIGQVVKSIGTIDSLPAGFKYAMAFNLGGIKELTVLHDADKQMLIVMALPKKESADAKTLVDTLFAKGVKTPQVSAKFQEVKARGSQAVGGQDMSYIVGSMADDSGNKFEGLVGCIVHTTKEETIVFYGIQPPGQSYNLQATEDFLKLIKNI